jgi:Beta-lactamase enzyme family
MRAAGVARRAVAVAAVVVLTACGGLGAGRAPRGAGPSASARRRAAPSAPDAHRRAASRGPAARPPARAASPDARLAAALAPVLRRSAGRIAVGVADPAAGAAATYHSGQRFDTASIVKADILAVLLLQHQQLGTWLTPGEQHLAAAMIDDSDNTAATALWNAAEGAPGLLAGNAVLGLHVTIPAWDSAWGLTTTTVTDQLRLLADLTSPRSKLSATARSYELTLMRDVEPAQAWGVTAAATPGTRPAVKNGWLPAGPDRTWVINSIGVVTHAGHTLLIAVLTSGQPSQPAGIRLVQAAATTAAAAITGPAR